MNHVLSPICQPTDVVSNLLSLAADQIDETAEGAVDFTIPLANGDRPAVLDPYNERLKIYNVRPEDLQTALCSEQPTLLSGKITAYARPGGDEGWENLGFRAEGTIRGYFRDDTDAHLWAAYPDSSREEAPREQLHDQTVSLALSKDRLSSPGLPEGFVCQVATPLDAPEIASLLLEAFADYPTPINPQEIGDQIEQGLNHFRVVRDSTGLLAAVASAGLDRVRLSAEMTDCATRPRFRGKGLMAHILWKLQHDVVARFRIGSLYTLARADEVGMNCVFNKLGYDFSGRLINNCRMPNGWESMNIWCKQARLC
jgi:beta-lysine N6-acetyltransferase